jgi:hypothetical protein
MAWYNNPLLPSLGPVLDNFRPQVEIIGPSAQTGSFQSAFNNVVHRPGPRPTARPKPTTRPLKGQHGATTTGHRPMLSGTRTPASSGSPANGSSSRQNGSPSRVVRRPQTFTDGTGQVRRISRTTSTPAPRPAAKPADPIKALVDDIIAGMNAPLDNDKKTLAEQSAGNINQTNRLHDFYDQQVGGIKQGAGMDFGTALQRAAELRGISADTIAANQDWLKGLTGPSGGGTMDAQIAQASGETTGAVNAANDQLAREIAGSGESLGDLLDTQRVAGRAAQRELNQQELLRRAAGIREIDRTKAENAAQRPMLEQQYRSQAAEQALKQQVAEAEWGLKSAQAQSLDNYRQGQLALGAARLEQQNEPKATKPPAPGRYGNIPKRYDTAIGKVWSDLNHRFNSEDGLPAPWRTAHQALVDQGLNPTAAAFLASMWFKDSITGSTPQNIRTMLANRGVSPAAQRRIINQAFGARAWQNLDRNPVESAVSFAHDALS